MKKTVRLYNVMFPVYMLFLLFPGVWLLSLPVNFAVDSLVLLLAVRHGRCGQGKQIWKKSILRVWLLGFGADFAGAALITALFYVAEGQINLSLYTHWYAEVLMALPGVALAGWLIYVMDRRWAFKKAELAPEHVRKLALALAVFTAPYPMLIPTALLYRF